MLALLRLGLSLAASFMVGAEAATSFSDDRGSVWWLAYAGTPLADADPLHETWRITLAVDTDGHALAGAFIDQVALKVSSSLFAYSLEDAPGSPADWTLVAGGLNAGGCNGNGSGFLCADSAAALNAGRGVAVAGGNGPGADLAWVFDMTVDNGALFTGLDQASIKARYREGSREHHFSANVTLVPEPQAFALLTAGLALLGWTGRLFRRWHQVAAVSTK